MLKVYWVSADKQSSIFLGTVNDKPTNDEVSACVDELYAQCADDTERRQIDAGFFAFEPAES